MVANNKSALCFIILVVVCYPVGGDPLQLFGLKL